MNRFRFFCFIIGYPLAFLAVPILAARAEDCPQAVKEVRKGVTLSNGSAEEQTFYRRALNLCPKLAEAYFNLGLNLTKQQQFDEAVKNFKQATEINQDPSFFLAWSNALLLKGDIDQAKGSYEKVISLVPEDVRAYQGLSVVYEKKGDLANAEDALRQAIQINNKDPYIFYNLGAVLEKTDRLDEAVVSYETAAKNKTNYTEAYLSLGRINYKLGRQDAAEKALKTASIFGAGEIDVWLALASFYERQEDFAAAREALTRALEINKLDQRAQTSLVVLSFKEGHKASAVEELKKLADAHANSAVVHGALGWAYLQLRQLEAAEQELSRAIELNQNDAFSRNNFGVLLEARGEKERAKEEFSRATRINPGLKEAAENLARVSGQSK